MIFKSLQEAVQRPLAKALKWNTEDRAPKGKLRDMKRPGTSGVSGSRRQTIPAHLLEGSMATCR
eukprot:447952-Amphidinium_carterae.1